MEKTYDLKERTLAFAEAVVLLCRKTSVNSTTIDIMRQVLRSSCSIGANYREANDALGKKDFIFRLKIARKEAKETLYYLRLFILCNLERREEILLLIKESSELKNILSAIIRNTT